MCRACKSRSQRIDGDQPQVWFATCMPDTSAKDTCQLQDSVPSPPTVQSAAVRGGLQSPSTHRRSSNPPRGRARLSLEDDGAGSASGAVPRRRVKMRSTRTVGSADGISSVRLSATRSRKSIDGCTSFSAAMSNSSEYARYSYSCEASSGLRLLRSETWKRNGGMTSWRLRLRASCIDHMIPRRCFVICSHGT